MASRVLMTNAASADPLRARPAPIGMDFSKWMCELADRSLLSGDYKPLRKDCRTCSPGSGAVGKKGKLICRHNFQRIRPTYRVEARFDIVVSVVSPFDDVESDVDFCVWEYEHCISREIGLQISAFCYTAHHRRFIFLLFPAPFLPNDQLLFLTPAKSGSHVFSDPTIS